MPTESSQEGLICVIPFKAVETVKLAKVTCICRTSTNWDARL